MADGCRAGSVCLDVINQTWSPMFGELDASLDAITIAYMHQLQSPTARAAGFTL